MATPPNPRVYLIDDFSWASGGDTALQNFYEVCDISGGGVTASVGRGTPRGYGLLASTNHGNLGWTVKDLDTGTMIARPTIGVAFGHDMRGLSLGAHPSMCYLGEAGGPMHLAIGLTASHTIAAQNFNGTILGSSNYILPASAVDGSGPMFDIEVIATCGTSNGVVQVKVDDVLVLDIQNANTRNGGAGTFSFAQIVFDSGRCSAEWRVHDGSDWLGSQWRVGYVPVATDGTYTNGTPTGAATILEAVDDDPADAEAEDTSYLSLDSSGLAKKVSFVSGPMPASAISIRDVHPQVIVKKSDAGTNTGKIGLKSGATESYNTTAQVVPDQWWARRLAFRTNPAAGNPLWTAVAAEASEVIWERDT